MKNSNVVSLGFRARTGRAVAVVLGGPPDAPVVLVKTEIKLCDPKMPATAQPYHVVMDLPWRQAERAAQKYVRVIQKLARQRVAELIKQQVSNGSRVFGAGIVGSADRDLAKIGNSHIRAHAAEGILFRRVLNEAAESNGLPWRVFSDRNLEEITSSGGGRNSDLKRRINDLRKSVAPPWRTAEKQAATAAWLVLHGGVR